MRVLRPIVLLIALVSCLSSTAAAVTLRGAQPCGTWLSDRKQSGLGSLTNEAWVVGYLSGRAVAEKSEVLKGNNNASLFNWLDKWCRANDSKSMDEGAAALFDELKRQKAP
jgi:hypothetical protein